VGVGVGVAAGTVRQAENSDVLPSASVAVQLIMPLVTPIGKSNGKLKAALPLPSVATPGTFPKAKGTLAASLFVHCASALKYQCRVNVEFVVLLSVQLIASSSGEIGSRPASFVVPRSVT